MSVSACLIDGYGPLLTSGLRTPLGAQCKAGVSGAHQFCQASGRSTSPIGERIPPLAHWPPRTPRGLLPAAMRHWTEGGRSTWSGYAGPLIRGRRSCEARRAKQDGGEGGIRTPDTLAGMPHFECGAFDHSATSPIPGSSEGAEPNEPALVAQERGRSHLRTAGSPKAKLAYGAKIFLRRRGNQPLPQSFLAHDPGVFAGMGTGGDMVISDREVSLTVGWRQRT